MHHQTDCNTQIHYAQYLSFFYDAVSFVDPPIFLKLL